MITKGSISYHVGNEIFYNKFQAAHHAATHNLNMHFDLYESAFDRVDWSVEPSLGWDSLLDIRAKQIADKNKPIVFYFSGGTDSLTIYKVFERNNIHIDLVWIRTHESGIEQRHQLPVLDLVRNNFYDKTTKFVFQNGDELVSKKAYSEENWIWEHGMRHQYGIVGSDKNSNDEIAAVLDTNDFISVIGFEKPRLHFDSTGVYSYQDDENYVRPMADPRFDCFYISPDLPELHVKQSYMMLNYIRSQNPQEVNPGKLTRYNDFHNASKFHWHEYSIKACGRLGDINNSQYAHFGNANCSLIIPSDGKFVGREYQGRMTDDFAKYADQQSFKNYVDGIMSVATDAAGKYLMTSKDNFYTIRQFRSKPYRLAF